MEKIEFNTEEIKLPSNGLVYPLDSPLSKGVIEMKYMSAKEEDILLNQNYLKKGTAIDHLLEALIVTPINYDDLIIGDKNAIMIAARILGYGPEYTFEFDNESHTIDLSQIDPKPIDESYFTPGINDFNFILPTSKIPITFKLLNGKDEKNINRELEGLKKIHKDNIPELSTRMKYLLTSVEGETEISAIREFVDKRMLARDSQALRSHIKKIQPDVDLTFFPSESSNGFNIPIGVNFFWPDN
jgi:hypothetical protein